MIKTGHIPAEFNILGNGDTKKGRSIISERLKADLSVDFNRSDIWGSY